MADGEGANPVVKWLGIGGAVLLGLAGLVEGAKKLDDAYELWTPKEKPIPSFPEYVSPKVDGGHTAEEFCNPKRDAYAAQNPDFDIKMVPLPGANHKDFLGHVTYEFHCQFIATRKSK